VLRPLNNGWRKNVRRIEGVSSRVLEIAKKEFLDHNFEDVSIRDIAAKAGTSPAAIYTRFKSKNGIFDAIVRDVAEEIKSIYSKGHAEYLDKIRQHGLNDKSSNVNLYVEIVDYAYEHKDEIILILSKSKGTKYENFVDELIEMDNSSRTEGMQLYDVSDIVSESQLTALQLFTCGSTSDFYKRLFVPILLGESREVAIEHIELMVRFYEAGARELVECMQ